MQAEGTESEMTDEKTIGNLKRRAQIVAAKGWLEGRPQRFVSELKLFGD